MLELPPRHSPMAYQSCHAITANLVPTVPTQWPTTAMEGGGARRVRTRTPPIAKEEEAKRSVARGRRMPLTTMEERCQWLVAEEEEVEHDDRGRGRGVSAASS